MAPTKQSLRALSKTIYPDAKGIKKIRYRGRFCLWGMTKPDIVNQTVETFSSPILSAILKDNKHFHEKPLKPYLNLNIKPEQRATLINQHFRLLEATFGENLEKFYTEEGYELLSFNDRNENSYRLVLKYHNSQSREGDLMVMLLDSQQRVVYTLAFTIGGERERTLYIGALQGASANIEDRPALIRTLTRSLHGLRTKSLVVEITLMIAKLLDCQRVVAVSNKGHIYQALRYMGSKRNRVNFDHDELWSEFGGKVLNKFEYQLDIEPQRKDPSTLKKTKRRLYEKRYKWLAETQEAVKNAIDAIRWQQ
ncbi:hypothetical protein A8L45_02525 [Veronia pacifica]|uniref:VirK protein n=2 Tax=Veronia pacifica TaxID=1080227 RepID=A0A1C3ERW8_9GAMM|nr:hypothetical protein A8L45_02525 [Veronia pacifica]